MEALAAAVVEAMAAVAVAGGDLVPVVEINAHHYSKLLIFVC